MNWLARLWRWRHTTPQTLPAPDTAAPVEQTDWCLVGNIVETHSFGESRETRRGSKHFPPGTKVYCLPAQWGDGYEKTVVVGRSRGSHRWITVIMQTDLITNWRAKVVYEPGVLRRLHEGAEGFNRQWKSKEDVESAARWLQEGRPLSR